MVQKIVLSNGVRLLCEKLDQVRSCAIGVWVLNGSCHEPEELSGISHFIEHMLFKGTETRSAAKLAEISDAIGGQVNAFTTKEHTCFYARTLDTHRPVAAELLCDMLLHSRFAQEDMDLERGVVLEEIDMYEDSPEDLVAEILAKACFPGQPLGRPILGSEEALNRIDHKAMADYVRRTYVGENVIVALSGSFSQSDVDAISRMFSAVPSGAPSALSVPRYQPACVVKEKPIEQNHLLLAFPTMAAADEGHYALAVLNNILGAGMSSRLFQRVREQSGLCYTIYSYTSLYAHCGVLGIYTALGRETQEAALHMILDELKRIKRDGVTEEELARTKEQLKISLLMGLESTTARMNTVARAEMTYGEYRTPEETVERLEAVTAADVYALAQELLDFDRMSFSAVGNVSSPEEYRAMLTC